MALFKCIVCNYIYEGDEVLDKCPLCGAPKEKMEALSEEAENKIYGADYSNSIHTEIINLATSIAALSEDGIEDDLDPTCVKVFTKVKDLAWEIKQLCKTELGNHVRKEKW